MPKSLLLFAFLAATPAFAQTLVVNPPNGGLSVPVGTYQGFEATVYGSPNNTVTWSITSGTGGTLVGNTVCTDGETSKCAISLYSTTAGQTYTVKATLNANSSITATGQVTYTAAPTLSTDPERTWATPTQISQLQSDCATGAQKCTEIVTQGNRNATTGSVGTITGIVTSGSPNVTSMTGTGCSQYNAIGGAGLAPGATVASISGSTLVMSANATASSGSAITLYCASDSMLGTDVGFSTSNGGGGYANANGINCGGGTGVPSPAYVAIDESIWWGGSEPGVQAWYFALLSKMDPTTGNRTAWTCKAYNTYMYYMNEVLKTNCGAGICSTHNWVGQQGNDWGAGVFQTVGILESENALSSADLSTIHSAWSKLLQEMVTETVITSNYPSPVGSGNQAAQLTDAGCYGASTPASDGCVYQYLRTTGNNYYASHLFQVFGMGATVDASWDPTLTTCAGGRLTVCSNGYANSLQAYANYGIGAYLYLAWLNYEDPSITVPAYNAFYGLSLTNPSPCYTTSSGYPSYATFTAPNCFGNGRGGLSHEGAPLYIGSMNRIREFCNIVYSSGYNQPSVYGPQLSICTSPMWDDTLEGWEHETLPVQTFASGLGTNVQNVFAYNEVNSTYDQTEFVGQIFGNLLYYDGLTGRTDRTNAEKWSLVNASIEYPYSNLVYQNVDFGVDAMLYLPTGSMWSGLGTITDPRTSMSPWYYSLNAGRFITGTSWTSTGSIIATLNPIYPTQDHEMGPSGRIDWFYNGDYITKGIDGYCEYYNSGNNDSCLPDYENTAAYFASGSVPSSQQDVYPQWVHGGDSNHGFGTAANIEKHTASSAYSYEYIDDTGQRAYDYGTAVATDVSCSSRDILFIPPHYVYLYDRGCTGLATFKKIFMLATGPVTISGNTSSWTSSLGTDSAYYHTLLPVGATVTQSVLPSSELTAAGDYAPNSQILVDLGTPTSVQALNVLEAQNHGTASTGATLVQSNAGQGFDGSLTNGNTLAMFMRVTGTFTGTTYPASGATTQYVADLAPNTTYSVSGAGAPSTCTADRAGVCTFSATGTGNITVGTPLPAGISAAEGFTSSGFIIH